MSPALHEEPVYRKAHKSFFYRVQDFILLCILTTSECTNLQSVQRAHPTQQPSCSEEPIQVHTLGVQAVTLLQPVAKVVELRLSQCRGWAKDHLMPRGRQVGLQSHINPDSTKAQQDGHLDEALGEVLLQVKHGVWASQQTPTTLVSDCFYDL